MPLLNLKLAAPAAIKSCVTKIFEGNWYFVLDTENVPFIGGESSVFVFEESLTKQRLCVRISRSAKDETPRHVVDMLKNEVRCLNDIKQAAIEGFSSLLHWDLTFDNPIRLPYYILDWANGTNLVWNDTAPCDRETRNKIIQSVARSCLDLCKVQEHSRKSPANSTRSPH